MGQRLTKTGRPRPASQGEVAAACGVSEMTVSRVLRDQPEVSPAKAAKVRAVAIEFGHVPDRIAGSPASPREQLVAVIVPSLSSMV